MPTFRAALGATLLASLAAPAHAGAHWLCNVSSDGTQLVCIADADPADREAAASPLAMTAQVRGTRFRSTLRAATPSKCGARRPKPTSSRC